MIRATTLFNLHAVFDPRNWQDDLESCYKSVPSFAKALKQAQCLFAGTLLIGKNKVVEKSYGTNYLIPINIEMVE
jgi:hypothetical protein